MLDELGPDDEDFAIDIASLVVKETSLSGTCISGRLKDASFFGLSFSYNLCKCIIYEFGSTYDY